MLREKEAENGTNVKVRPGSVKAGVIFLNFQLVQRNVHTLTKNVLI